MSQSRGASFDFLIVPAGPADAEALAQVHVRSWRETYRGLLPDAYLARMSEEIYARRFRRSLLQPRPGEATLAALTRDGLVGYAEAGPSRSRVEGEGEIATLYLLKSAQRRGVGRRLVSQTAKVLASEGARALVISVLYGNMPARGFYEALGGKADPPRHERGPGGLLYPEVAYRWPDIGVLL
ncbi:GNAT family N-acetyltransferase [Phenylobacterium deserti]|uniref:GNAT family N-acetyltransferase n=1 Tax=Phenylobacterium deserti TaxID=1914756 RepID=A0A328AWI5_9CAUL|nr:GNAT family N-acetyltransferase [Phenylobacterium deserti]RAK57218.1 GNAT family N-acetyltransferase [Phenylobacterium deserti]